MAYHFSENSTYATAASNAQWQAEMAMSEFGMIRHRNGQQYTAALTAATTRMKAAEKRLDQKTRDLEALRERKRELLERQQMRREEHATRTYLAQLVERDRLAELDRRREELKAKKAEIEATQLRTVEKLRRLLDHRPTLDGGDFPAIAELEDALREL